MSREGVKPACCQKACCDWKDMLQDLYEKTINSYRVLNGLYPDGTGELRITAGDGIIIDTLSGNEVRISADELAGYSAIAPIQLDTDLNTISIAIDNAPTLNSSNAVRSGGTYSAIRTRGSSQDPVEEATHATNADYQTSADSATNADHQTSADSATNADHQTSADNQITAGSATTAGSQTSAGEAAKLSTARTIQTDLESTTAASFDGSANITPGIIGVLPIQNGGTGVTTLRDIVSKWACFAGEIDHYGTYMTGYWRKECSFIHIIGTLTATDTATSRFSIIEYDKLSQLIGDIFDTDWIQGHWEYRDIEGSSRLQYGSGMGRTTNTYPAFTLGRFYNTSGNYGAWNANQVYGTGTVIIIEFWMEAK